MPQPPASVSPKFRRARRAHENGELDQAERLYADILRGKPQHFDALHLLGMLYYQRGALDAAEKLLRAALRVDSARGDAYADLGLILLAMARPEDALAAYEAAHAIAPDDPEALNGRGVVLLRQGRTGEALASFERAIGLAPDHIDALGNRGNALLKLNRPGEAIASYDAGLKLAPRHARLLTNRAIALRRLDRPHEALLGLNRAIAGNPDFAEARFVESLVKLTLGDFVAGWSGYEQRWATAALAPHRRNFTKPLWLGREPLAGKTILLYAEQGYGDTIQFVRYAPRVAALGARVILEVQPELTRLMANSMAGPRGIAVIAHGEPLPAFDLQCPLMSLPLAFRTQLATIPAEIPYLVPPAADATVGFDRREPPFGFGRKPKVGLVWAGDPLHKNDLNRSIRLATLQPLLALPHLRFVSLQQEISAEDGEVMRGHPGLQAGGPFRDFAQTAAAIAGLDAVIAVDTAVAHLAGAMGKPLYLLLPFGADFRWLRERADSPWYPSARLFRQHAFNDWGRAVDALRQKLTQPELMQPGDRRVAGCDPPPAGRKSALPLVATASRRIAGFHSS
jgi:tetratricopeptide (TPR) repeat protein